ncbi:unnamed protein product, partial [marine sediment metagenome]
IEMLILRIANLEKVEISENALRVIKRRAFGHARDAVQLLEKFLILGEKDFVSSIPLADETIKRFLGAALQGEKTVAATHASALAQFPLAYLKEDFERFWSRLFDHVFVKNKKAFSGLMPESKLMNLFEYYIKMKKVMFSNSSDLYSVLVGASPILTPLAPSTKKTESDRFARV